MQIHLCTHVRFCEILSAHWRAFLSDRDDCQHMRNSSSYLLSPTGNPGSGRCRPLQLWSQPEVFGESSRCCPGCACLLSSSALGADTPFSWEGRGEERGLKHLKNVRQKENPREGTK